MQVYASYGRVTDLYILPPKHCFAIRAFRAQFEMRLHFAYRVRCIVVRVSMIKGAVA